MNPRGLRRVTLTLSLATKDKAEHELALTCKPVGFAALRVCMQPKSLHTIANKLNPICKSTPSVNKALQTEGLQRVRPGLQIEGLQRVTDIRVQNLRLGWLQTFGCLLRKAEQTKVCNHAKQPLRSCAIAEGFCT